MGTAVTFEELARLSGEELPPRLVLSSVVPAGADQSVYPAVVKTEHGTTVAYACTYRQNAGSPPLLVFLGLASQDPGHTTTCIPAAISSH
ncbi:hypothetical protein [Streptomyces albireticuli]|uniref:Uncharacterized protein n=1 Tax=Streptomyces albireticuli TaxID=1940 RepID=A0A2A2D9M6_9ACTN|nr:hypothetical protein [Streptomyces albireticuli]MCD9140567.1 hypothetical protein [Streptomyces albireticuli]MCD9161471.1 hypothetical protein [Streptomyces albireticuli]MCD9192959.1 hypothetical protein [Streptomyces albireticuli]PAU48070.1 hypothetical protein CK936_15170 [Streptomyces albireticuli]